MADATTQKGLVVVESPAKAKTIEKYLGKNFKVLASYGHVRDLLPKEGAVDPEDHFAVKYQVIEKNAKHIEAIISALKKADVLYLATDPDREGEAISWHINELVKAVKTLKNKPVHRVVFYEVTKNAVKEAFSKPGELSQTLVDAQLARRILDYLVGFKLSPLLWRKIRRGLSAGRVQSPALRMIVEREEAIEQFNSQEYWSIVAAAASAGQPFNAKLVEYAGEKLNQFSIVDAERAAEVTKTLRQVAQGKLKVSKVEHKQRKRNPAAPFTTSTLQQEAARKLGFTTKRTMRIAQQLYEGIDVGQGTTGLITYMRTDSVNLSQDALKEIRALIAERFGQENLPETPRYFKTKAKNAQEAHEAIRPTVVQWLPETIKNSLTPEQYKLYDLIWKRTIACQMIHASIDTMAVDLLAGTNHRFHATGSRITHPGFIAVYQEGVDEAKATEDGEALLPPMQEGDWVDLLDIISNQHFTEPPPRYTEASLVKALEEYGIGRPSTYAAIISTLQQREYVILEQKRFQPTDVGRIVHRFLLDYFDQYVNYDFTANLEDQLDAISRGEKSWLPLMEEFWQPFKERIDKTEENVKRKDVTQEALNEACPQCGKPLSIRLGRRGRFVGCTGYPDCDYTRNLHEDATAASQPEIVPDHPCPKCQAALVVKMGRYGKFIGCSQYPTCKHMEPLEKSKDMGIACPQCHKGNLLKRKSRYGKIFYSCGTYPDCNYAVWNMPVNQPCPQCHWPVTTIKTTKRRGTERVCPQKTCGFAEPSDASPE